MRQAMNKTGDTPFPSIDWRMTKSKAGVALRENGEGEAVLIFPGMEGSGESCLHLVAPVIQQLKMDGKSCRMILVDYAHEEHDTFDELILTIKELIHGVINSKEPCIFWAQSYGNLLATKVANHYGINIRKFILVSPFTELPDFKVRWGTLILYVTPTFLYRATIKPLGRYLFGPTGDQNDHPFFDALQRATSSMVRRRTSWLISKNFSNDFSKMTVLSRVWMGDQDRLVDLREQRSFFSELARKNSNYKFSMIEGSGHVVLPSDIAQSFRKELLAWLEG